MARNDTIETRMLGAEPVFTGPATRVDLMIAFNYYSYLHDIRDTRQWVLDWMTTDGYTSKQRAKYKRANTSNITQTMASAARMLSRGLVDKHIEDKLKSHIDFTLHQEEIDQPEVALYRKTQPFNQVIADIDDVIDDFYKSDYKTVQEFEIASDAKVTDIKQAYRLYLELLEEIKLEKSHLKPAQRKRYVSQIELIVAKLGVIGAAVKRRAPQRKRRAIKKTPSKFQYLSDHGDYSSIDPDDIFASNILWCYNVKNRKLTKLIAPVGEKLSMKGTTVTGFDPKKSWQLTLRKPDDVLPTLVTGNRRDIDKMVKTIKTKQMPANGRTNGDVLLIRAFK